MSVLVAALVLVAVVATASARPVRSELQSLLERAVKEQDYDYPMAQDYYYRGPQPFHSKSLLDVVEAQQELVPEGATVNRLKGNNEPRPPLVLTPSMDIDDGDGDLSRRNMLRRFLQQISKKVPGGLPPMLARKQSPPSDTAEASTTRGHANLRAFLQEIAKFQQEPDEPSPLPPMNPWAQQEPDEPSPRPPMNPWAQQEPDESSPRPPIKGWQRRYGWPPINPNMNPNADDLDLTADERIHLLRTFLQRAATQGMDEQAQEQFIGLAAGILGPHLVNGAMKYGPSFWRGARNFFG